MKKSFRTVLALALAVAVVTGLSALVLAGDPAAKPAAKPATSSSAVKPAMSGAPDMAMMKAEMMKCAVCKNMAAKMDQFGTLKAEVVHLGNGMAMIHMVADPSKVEAYHVASAATAEAGKACMAFTDDQAKTELCQFCQEMRTAAKAGASISSGLTKTGDILVITSSDPMVQKQISALETKCQMMTASM
jgi:hypothetical protein